MKGCNTIRMNPATVIEAVQEYLDRRSIGAFDLVTGVSWDSTDHVLRVTFKEREEDDDA